MAFTGVIARALMEKLDIADGVCHAQFLNHRGESVSGKLRRIPSFFSLSKLPLERHLRQQAGSGL
jgi:hypothetical protein